MHLGRGFGPLLSFSVFSDRIRESDVMKQDIYKFIVENVNILDVASKYIQLKKVGVNYRGFSPFKYETKPSFFVSPHKKIFKCFSSGHGGDVIKLVSLLENVSKEQAIIKLAEDYGFKDLLAQHFHYEEDTLNKRQIHINNIKILSDIFHAKRDEACRYLIRRGLDQSFYKLYKIGYNDGQWLKENANSLDIGYLKEIGLLTEDGDDLRAFAARSVAFPLKANGNMIAFYFRSTINSRHYYMKNNEFYTKSKTLFGLENLSGKVDYIILVEGILDALSIKQLGYNNVVAMLGLFTSSENISKITRMTRAIVLGLDNDVSGIMQNLNLFDRLKDYVDLYFLDYADTKDANEFLQKYKEKRKIQILDPTEYLRKIEDNGLINRILIENYRKSIEQNGHSRIANKRVMTKNSDLVDSIMRDKVFWCIALFLESYKQYDRRRVCDFQKLFFLTPTSLDILINAKNELSMINCEIDIQEYINLFSFDTQFIMSLYEEIRSEKGFDDIDLSLAYSAMESQIEDAISDETLQIIQKLLRI